MNKIGTFKILQSFKITGRGLVASGHIVDGVVKTGAFAFLEISNEKMLCQIKGVDWGRINTNGESMVGLLFSNEERNIEQVKLGEQVVEILESK